MSEGNKVHPPICRICRRVFEPRDGNRRVGTFIFENGGPELCRECSLNLNIQEKSTDEPK